MMRVPELKVWIPEDEPEPAEANCIGWPSTKALKVAEGAAQDRFDADAPRWTIVVHVRDEDGKLHAFAVEAEQKFVFTAKEVPVADG